MLGSEERPDDHWGVRRVRQGAIRLHEDHGMVFFFESYVFFDQILRVTAHGWQTTPTNGQLPPRAAEQGVEVILRERTKLEMTIVDRGTSLPCRIIPEYKFTTCRLSHGPPATDVLPFPLILRTA